MNGRATMMMIEDLKQEPHDLKKSLMVFRPPPPPQCYAAPLLEPGSCGISAAQFKLRFREAATSWYFS
jgi:hypothetical protein